MGWVIVEPIPVIQIDPAIYDAETQVFAVPIVGQTLKAIVKAIQERLANRLPKRFKEELLNKLVKKFLKRRERGY